jgi:hypothetical protein
MIARQKAIQSREAFTSQYLGVHKHSATVGKRMWVARVYSQGEKQTHVGNFETAEAVSDKKRRGCFDARLA